MLLRNVPVFGLQLLLILHTSKAFVLLTANIEDVKKLATKFVSESLADKIATFIARAAHHVMTQHSEEIHKDVSEENKHYNIRQRSSNEQEFDHKQHSKGIRQKKYKNDEYLDELDANTSKHKPYDEKQFQEVQIKKDKSRYSRPRTNSIENNNVDDMTLNKTFSAVFDLNLRAEKDTSPAKTIVHSKYPQYKLLATSGNMILTTMVSKESNENKKYDNGNKNWTN